MRIHGGFVLAAGLACALQAAAAVPPPEILVLSNRADLISGGDALVEIKMPPIYTPPVAKVTLNGAPANQFFALRPNGRYMGVVSGLKDGTNVLVARAPGGPAAQIIDHQPSHRRAGFRGSATPAVDLRDPRCDPGRRHWQSRQHASDGGGNHEGQRSQR